MASTLTLGYRGARFAAALALATAAVAQVTITGIAKTDLVASAAGGPTQTLRAGTRLTSNRLYASGQCGGAFAAASLDVTVSGTTVTFGTWASSYCASGAVAGGHILLTLSAPTPTAGSLHFDDGSGATGGYSVDIGNDGTIELVNGSPLYQKAQDVSYSLVVDANGVDVLITGGSSAATGIPFSTLASTDLTLSFDTNGIVVPEGGACGPELAARYRLATGPFGVEQFDFTVTSSPVTPYAFFVIGLQRLNVVIPPLSCVLRTDIVVPLLASVNPAGEASWRLPVPPGIGPVGLRVQYLAATIDPVTGAELWRTSEAIRVQLP